VNVIPRPDREYITIFIVHRKTTLLDRNKAYPEFFINIEFLKSIDNAMPAIAIIN
jgi:hypothetical protein